MAILLARYPALADSIAGVNGKVEHLDRRPIKSGRSEMISRRHMMVASTALALQQPVLGLTLPTWQRLPTEPYRGKQDDIAFVSPDSGWYGNGDGKLYRTIDGGQRWEKVWE